LVSTGDESATRLEELMEAMVGDPTVSVIMLFLEGVNDGMRFRRSALAAQIAGKPIVMLQVGKSEKGREAVQSHTGRIAGTREVFAAVAAEAGIIETRSFVEFFGTAKTLAQQCVRARALSRNRRAAVITVSGGAASLCADQLAEIGWSLPDFTNATVAAIEAATSQSNVHNPADITGVWRDPSKVAGTMSAIALDDSIDTIFVALGAGGAFAHNVAEALSSAALTLTQDVFVSWVGMTPETREIFDRAGVPAFDDFPLAVQAAEACAKYAESQHRLEDAAELLRILSKRADTREIDAHGEPSLWTVTRTLSDLRDAGLPCAQFDISAALDPVDIANRSEKVGYPAVLKLSSSSLNHKSDEGGVALRLSDSSAVLAAARAFQQLAENKRLAEPSVLIQKMASGVEILVGIKRDAVFGLLLVLGLGGTMAELHAEIVATPLPTTPAGLHALLSRHHKLNTLLDGYRGQAPVDRETLVSFLHAVAQWAESKGATLQEVDLNPVMAAAKDISIVDGRVIWN
jgi:acyl-CoA synthetase (NDP forming)